MLFGTRWTHFPLNPVEGAGTGSWNSFAVASQERKASEPFSTASSIVSPSAMHPGRSGNSTSHPPPSAFDRRRIMKGYSIFFMGHLIDQSEEFLHVHRLDWFSRRGRKLCSRGVSESNVTFSRLPGHHVVPFPL